MQVDNINVKYKSTLVFESLKNNRFYLILLFSMIFGILLGSISIKVLGKEFIDFLNIWVKNYIKFRSDSGFFILFFNRFLLYLSYIIFIAAFGYGISGLPILPIIMLLRGFSSGIISGILYREYSLSGIVFADLILLPANLIASLTIIWIASYSLNLSWQFFKVVRSTDIDDNLLKLNGITVLKKSLYSVCIFIIASLIESCFITFFIKFFSFV